MKTAVVLQPSFIPWLGYFEQMHKCNVFVYLDDVQYTKNDWRNRNRIKTKTGCQWLTVPVSFHLGQQIREAVMDSTSCWQKKLMQAIRTSYGRSSFFHLYFSELEILLTRQRNFLIDLNIDVTSWIMQKIGLDRNIVLSSQLPMETKDRNMRLIEICKLLGCDGLYEGASGRNYMDLLLYQSHGIAVEFQHYAHPYYSQLWLREQGFVSHLSIIDLLFNHGPDSLGILSGGIVVQPPEGMKIRHADDVQAG